MLSMTRALSAFLGAKEPEFSLSLRRLEKSSGLPSADIRLSSEISRATKAKLLELGLDPEDTTGEELYAALRQRVQADDERLAKTLQEKFGMKDGSDVDNIGNIARALGRVPVPKSCFALKNSVAKTILKEITPKKVMKQLNYRSLDSMLKHETAASLFAAAWLIEAAVWRRNIMARYKSLQPTDFEMRQISIDYADSKRWQKLAEGVVAREKHNILSVKELGAVVFLPLPAEHPSIVSIITLTLALHAMNEIRAGSTYLKLCQVKPNFGSYVQTVVADEPRLSASFLDQPIAWRVIQRYYARFADALQTEVFEPHVQAEDLSWHSIEKVLSYLEPSLEFWHHTSSLGLLHKSQPVSLNIVDVALSECNQFSYKDRLMHYFRYTLWHELAIRYLKPDKIEQTILTELKPALAEETVTA
jgi:hypothetical protein